LLYNLKLILGFASDNLVTISFINELSFDTDFKNFFLAGTLKNRSCTSSIVPLFIPHSVTSDALPPSIDISYPKASSSCLDFKLTLPTDAIDGSASPLNPRVCIL